MAYKILINSKGVPVLIEVPEKPICECEEIDGAGDFDDTHDRCEKRFIAYEQAPSTALADESKHIAFRNNNETIRFIRYNCLSRPDLRIEIGQTFDLPDNVGVSFEYYEKCDVWCGGAGCVPFQPNKEKCSGNPQKKLERKLAILTPKQDGIVQTPFCVTSQEPESVPSCGEQRQYPHREICGLCNRVSPVGFWVPNEIWKASVHHSRINDIHCLSCFIERADEKLIDWSNEIKFYPVSLVSHIRDLNIQL